MQVMIKFFSKKFRDDNSTKEAYLKACKWIALNIMGKKFELGDITWRAEKVEDDETGLPTVKLDLFTTVDENEFKNQMCEGCKEFHSSFYINQQQNCNGCNMMAYRSRLENKIRIKKAYKKELLGKQLDKF